MSVHQSLILTPEPSACSTQTKTQEISLPATTSANSDVKRNLYDVNSSTDSLGILSLDDMQSCKDSSFLTSNAERFSDTPPDLRKRLIAVQNTKALLDKYQEQQRKRLQQTTGETDESTVDESDLLKESLGNSLNSTRSHHSRIIKESDLLKQSNVSLVSNPKKVESKNNESSANTSAVSLNMTAMIEDMQQRIRANPKVNLCDLLLPDSTKFSFRASNGELDSAMFQSRQDNKQIFEEDKKVWNEMYATIPCGNNPDLSFSSQQPNSTYEDKLSIGEFFLQKSDHCSLFGSGSPMKNQPIPLVNSTTIEDDASSHRTESRASERSILSVSDIRNLITAEENSSKIVERLMQPPPTPSSRRSHVLSSMHRQEFSSAKSDFNGRASLGTSQVNSTRYSKQYASSNDLRSQGALSPKIYTTQSLNHIPTKENKENMQRHQVEEKNRTATSVRSSSSMDSIPDGLVKLASSKTELVWGCVKEGRTSTEDVTIRNKTNRRVKYVITSNNPSFKLLNVEPQGDKIVVLLHPLETRELHVACTPAAAGPCVGHLQFVPILRRDELLTKNVSRIALFAYGGHANINIKGQTRDLNGKMWISLGCVDGRNELSCDLVVNNTGTIDGFVSLTVNSKSLCAYEDIQLTPSKVLIRRGTEQTIRVKFQPSKNDLSLLNAVLANPACKTTEIAFIRMIAGADINRQRINKINKKITKDYDVQSCDPLSQQLSSPFQGAIPSEEIRYFKENAKSVKTLMQSLESTEISLLVDRDLDATFMSNVDESTVIFKTMIGGEDTLKSEHLGEHSYEKCFNLEPSNIILTPPTKCVDNLFFTSHFHSTVAYKISVSPAGPLCVSPSTGEVNPGEIKKLLVECDRRYSKKSTAYPRMEFKVILEVEDEVFGVSVSVLNL